MLKYLKRREFTLALILVVLLALVTLRAPGFLKVSNLNDILNDTSILVIVAIGQMMVIVTGGADLSVASGIALTGMSVAMLNWYYPGIPIIAIIFLSLLIGLALGAINGTLVAFGGIPPIIATLGTMGIYRGLVFLESGGQWVSASKMPESFRDLPHYTPLLVTNLLAAALIVTIVAAIFLRLSRT
ncbi:MAG: ABC transporter permease, partial [Spirochaetia bacterium]